MRSLYYFLLSLVVALSAYGCSANSKAGSSGFGGEGGEVITVGSTGTGSNTGGNGDGGCLFNCSGGVGGGGVGGGGQQGTLIISPPDPVLTVIDANIPQQQLTVTLNGQDVTNSVTWVYERPDIGDVAATKFVPTGKVGGVGTLTAQFQKSQGTTTVTVNVKKTNNAANVDPTVQAAFDEPVGADPGMKLVYPYNETVFPLGVLAPEMQWNGTAAGDVYRLKVTEKHMEYVAFFQANPPSRWLMPQGDWDGIGSSGTGAQSDPVTVQIARYSGGKAYQPTIQTWHVAQGKLKGVVYYWELPNGAGDGRILRIQPDQPQADQFFTPGQCWGCHTVSRDGTKMAAVLDPPFPFPFLTIDLTQSPAVQKGISAASGLAGTFAAFNDKGDRLILSNDDSSHSSTSEFLRIVDPSNGQVLNPNAMGNGCGEPAWSPDGTKLAAICGMNGSSWMFDDTSGNLTVADVAADGFTVSNVQQIVPKAGGNGRPAYPSFAPGSEYIAFGRPTAGSRSTGNGDLWMVKKDGSELKKLAVASNDNRSFNPVFAPLRAGGYYWLVFISRRDYGNQLVNANNQQLWITAIDDPPSAADPSHPPFYMRGQEMTQKSENAYYALPPCKQEGEDCTTGVDCCGGQCVKDPAGGSKYICGQPPPPGQCSGSGNKCNTKADCCDPTDECLDGFCQQPPPK